MIRTNISTRLRRKAIKWFPPARNTRLHSFPKNKEISMKRIFYLALAIVAMAGLAIVAEAQTFKVQRFSIGGDGGTDYLTAEPGTGRIFVSRGTHVMEIGRASCRERV